MGNVNHLVSRLKGVLQQKIVARSLMVFTSVIMDCAGRQSGCKGGLKKNENNVVKRNKILSSLL